MKCNCFKGDLDKLFQEIQSREEHYVFTATMPGAFKTIGPELLSKHVVQDRSGTMLR